MECTVSNVCDFKSFMKAAWHRKGRTLSTVSTKMYMMFRNWLSSFFLLVQKQCQLALETSSIVYNSFIPTRCITTFQWSRRGAVETFAFLGSYRHFGTPSEHLKIGLIGCRETSVTNNQWTCLISHKTDLLHIQVYRNTSCNLKPWPCHAHSRVRQTSKRISVCWRHIAPVFEIWYRRIPSTGKRSRRAKYSTEQWGIMLPEYDYHATHE